MESGRCDPSCVEFEFLCGVCVPPPPPRVCPARCERAANSGEHLIVVKPGSRSKSQRPNFYCVKVLAYLIELVPNSENSTTNQVASATSDSIFFPDPIQTREYLSTKLNAKLWACYICIIELKSSLTPHSFNQASAIPRARSSMIFVPASQLARPSARSVKQRKKKDD